MPPPEYCLFWINHWATCMQKGEWSGWVQAIGSVFAFIGAGAGIWWQVRRQGQQRVDELREARSADAAERLAEEVRRLSILASGVFHCIVEVRRMQTSNKEGWPLDDGLRRLRNQVGLLAAVPALEIPDWWATHAMKEAQYALDVLIDGLAHAEHSGPVDDTQERLHHRRVPYLNLAEDTFIFVEGMVGDALAKRGAALPEQTYRINGEVIYEVPRRRPSGPLR